MIRETIVTSLSVDGVAHIAPMGIQSHDREVLIMPFRPSRTLDNILSSRHAVLNHTDDVRIFAGCLTGRHAWPLVDAEIITGKRLANTLAHSELEMIRWEDDPIRPRLFCRIVHEKNHAPFRGFNRAQHSVLEAAILVSRLRRLSWQKIESELDYLRIGFDKTAGEGEREAWTWLMEAVEAFKSERLSLP
jgi:hypothetical protein